MIFLNYTSFLICPLVWRMLVQRFNDSSKKCLINSEDICKTPITTLLKLYEFFHMPFGLAWRMLVELFNDSSTKWLINPEDISKTPITTLLYALWLEECWLIFSRFIVEVSHRPRGRVLAPYNDTFQTIQVSSYALWIEGCCGQIFQRFIEEMTQQLSGHLQNPYNDAFQTIRVSSYDLWLEECWSNFSTIQRRSDSSTQKTSVKPL